MKKIRLTYHLLSIQSISFCQLTKITMKQSPICVTEIQNWKSVYSGLWCAYCRTIFGNIDKKSKIPTVQLLLEDCMYYLVILNDTNIETFVQYAMLYFKTDDRFAISIKSYLNKNKHGNHTCIKRLISKLSDNGIIFDFISTSDSDNFAVTKLALSSIKRGILCVGQIFNSVEINFLLFPKSASF